MTGHDTTPVRHDPQTRVATTIAGLLAIWAYAGAIGLIVGGFDFGEPVNTRLPWHSPVIAGVALLLVVAVPMTVAAMAAWQDWPHSGELLIVAGAALVGWIVVQIAVIRTFLWLQPVCAVLGLLVGALGRSLLTTRRRTSG